MNQTDKAKRFAELHVKGAPLLLYNAWDAGSAKSILAAGAQAIATSSWSVAEAQGYRDGEAIPIALAEQIVARIAATIDVPVTVDFEGGYSEDDGELAAKHFASFRTGRDRYKLRGPGRQGFGPLRHRPAGAAARSHSQGGGAEGRRPLHQRADGSVPWAGP